MSSINVLNIIVNNPVDSFLNPFKFEIVFECLSELKEGKIIFFLSLIFKNIKLESSKYYKFKVLLSFHLLRILINYFLNLNLNKFLLLKFFI